MTKQTTIVVTGALRVNVLVVKKNTGTLVPNLTTYLEDLYCFQCIWGPRDKDYTYTQIFMSTGIYVLHWEHQTSKLVVILGTKVPILFLSTKTKKINH